MKRRCQEALRFSASHKVSRRDLLAGIGSLAVSSLISCARPASSDRLRIAIETPPLTLDPRGPFNADTAHIQQLIFNTLVTKGPDFDLVPELATEWDVDPAFTNPVFRLKPGITFHNGREFTSRDVAFTFESLARGEFGKSANFHALERVECLDPFTVRFVSKAPNPGLLVDLIAVGILPEGTSSQSQITPVGTGPFRVGAFDRDGPIQLDAFDQYFAGRSIANGIDVRVIPDAGTREAALQASEIDVAINTTFSPEALGRLGTTNNNLRVVTSPGGGIHYVALNTERYPLSDVRMRRALSLATNRVEIIATLLGGRAQLAVGPLPPGHWATAVVDPIPFDPEEARLLARDADGRRLAKIEILIATGGADVALASVLQESWRQVGLEARITVAEAAVFFDRLTYGDFETAIHRFTGGNQFTTIFKGAFHSRSIHTRGNRGGEINYARFSDPEIDSLIDRADMSAERIERLSLYGEIQRRIASASPWIPLWHPDNVAVLGSRVGPVVLNRGGDFYCLRSGPLVTS